MIRISLLLLILAMIPYPIDGYETSGIRRLLYLQRVVDGTIPGTAPVSGALKSIQDIRLRFLDDASAPEGLPPQDADLARAVNALFPSLSDQYSVAVLDMTPGKPVRYAMRKGSAVYQPGSVGKIVVMAAVLNELRTIHPHSFARRQEIMRTRQVRAGEWALPNQHTVPFFDPETNKLVKRTVRADDVFTLYEWIDHMMSVSSNGAASVVWREAMLMRVFGREYATLTEERANAWFAATSKADLSALAMELVNAPLREVGITEDEWRLGSFFTQGATRRVPRKGGSASTVQGVMKFLIRMEAGEVVDAESSLEMKRFMYMTDRRIRYAASPALRNAAVYFKSGSLYSCQEEEGYTCAKYMGNRVNYMNSVAIVEHPDGTQYMVALMSNVVKKNSASDHMELASSIDRIIRRP
jgi:hypothetical protein